MSTKKDRKALTIGSGIILAIIVISFIGGPIISSIIPARNTNQIFGSYDGTEIRYSPNNFFGISTQSYLSYFQEQLNKQNIDNTTIRIAMRNAFDQTVEMLAFLQIAKKNRYLVSNEKINEITTSISEFQDEGKFNLELYKSIPKNRRVDLFETQKEIELASTIKADLSQAESMSENELNFLNYMNKHMLTLQYVVFNHSSVADSTILSGFAEKNPDLFVKHSYQSLTATDEDTAIEVRKRLYNGESTFQEEIESYSIKDEEKEGEQTRFAHQITQDESEEALDAIKNMQVNEGYSEILRTNSGNFAIYQKTKEEEIPDYENDDILKEIQDYLNSYDPDYINEEIEKRASAFIEDTKTSSFFIQAGVNNLEINTSKPFPVNVGNHNIFAQIESEENSEEPIYFLGNNAEILADLFALHKEDVSQYYTIHGKTYVFYILDKVDPENNASIAKTEDDVNRISAFVRTNKSQRINSFVVDETKLNDNFQEIFDLTFPEN